MLQNFQPPVLINLHCLLSIISPLAQFQMACFFFYSEKVVVILIKSFYRNFLKNKMLKNYQANKLEAHFNIIKKFKDSLKIKISTVNRRESKVKTSKDMLKCLSPRKTNFIANIKIKIAHQYTSCVVMNVLSSYQIKIIFIAKLHFI